MRREGFCFLWENQRIRLLAPGVSLVWKTSIQQTWRKELMRWVNRESESPLNQESESRPVQDFDVVEIVGTVTI